MEPRGNVSDVYPSQVPILKRVLARAKTQQAVVEKLGVSREWFRRALRGEVPLGAEACVQIALEYSEDALALLRAAGKTEFAALLQRSGVGAGDVSATDRDLLRALNSLPPALQQPIRNLIARLSEREEDKSHRPARRRR